MRWAVAVVLAACSYHSPGGGPPPGSADAALGGGISIEDAAVDTVPAEPRCTARYGTIESYELCRFSETECTFFAHTGGNCNDACAAAGGTCRESRDGDCDDFDGHPSHDCLRTLATQVCFCSN